MSYSALIVDDEPLAREAIVTLLSTDDEIEVVGECGDGVQATHRIEELEPDIVFLDIEMPNLRGIDVPSGVACSRRPAWIFITAFEEHAIQAFELRADDYLLKPFSDQRFYRALKRVKRRIRQRRLNEAMEGVVGARRATAQREPCQRIAVPQHGRRIFVSADDIYWIESADYYARLHTRDRSFLVRKSLDELERTLDPRRFVRTHRGAIVQLEFVSEVRRQGRGKRWLSLRNGQRVPLARARARAVESQLLG